MMTELRKGRRKVEVEELVGSRLEPSVKLKYPVLDDEVARDREPHFFQTSDQHAGQQNKYSFIGKAIRALRNERGVSQEALAKGAGVNRTTIARVECGIFKSLSITSLEKIAFAVGADLKTLLIKAEQFGESLDYRGHLNQVAFSLEYPEDGFQIFSLTPKRKEFFFGKIEIGAQKSASSIKLPHPEQVYLHFLEGKVLLIREMQEFLMKPGDSFAFCGVSDYELYNPDPLKKSSALFITYPSFLFV